MQWILGIALAVAVFMILKQWGALTPDRKKAATWKAALVVLGAVLLFMVLTGRVHVLVAAVAALIPLLKKLPALLRFAPLFSRIYQQQGPGGHGHSGYGQEGQRQGGQGRGRSASSGNMSVKEACDILGVDQDCSQEDIILAHRRLMQKLHPDRGGNDYLAAKVNEAKTVLLNRWA